MFDAYSIWTVERPSGLSMSIDPYLPIDWPTPFSETKPSLIEAAGHAHPLIGDDSFKAATFPIEIAKLVAELTLACLSSGGRRALIFLQN